MATFVTVNQTNNQIQGNYDRAKLLIGTRNANRTETGLFAYDNSGGGSDVTIIMGTVLGRIASTRKLVVINPSATDGSQFPVGILIQDVTVAAGVNQTGAAVTYCKSGDIASELVAFPAGVTYNTVVSLRTLRDRIQGDTAGIILVDSTSMTKFDNQ